MLTLEAARTAAADMIATALAAERAAQRPDPDILAHLTDCAQVVPAAADLDILVGFTADVALYACLEAKTAPDGADGWTLGARYEFANGLEAACVYADGELAVLADMQTGEFHPARGYVDGGWTWELLADEEPFSAFDPALAALAA